VYQFTISYFRDLENRWRELQVVQYVSERRRLEDELRRINDELEKKVEERTRELQEKQIQLAQTEKMAALGNLVAGVAHEINTPLGALNSNNDVFVRLIGKLRNILDELHACGELKDHPELRAVFENVEKLNEINQTAAERIVNIVNSLRRFARLDRAEKDTVDIHDGLETTLTLVRHELKNRVDVVKDFGDIPQISCFPNQLNQVFMNLLVNASQAIEGTGKITIKTRARDGRVVVEISDTGKGISRQDLARVFDPGFTTKGSGIGTGLGLSIVHQIIHDHGGRVEVDSEPGEGTTFRLLLPVK
ncbi:MAG: GHKL domain-containing protein, partial [Candidatus Zixiibacteriota bacterium]